MNNWARYAVTIAAVALISGCSAQGDTSPIGKPGAMQSLLPGTASQDLIYVSDVTTNKVYVYMYPAGKRAGVLSGFNAPRGECVDAVGNVWIVNQNPAEVIEYAHGGSTPIATLSVPGSSPDGCTIDPATGNLAVTNQGNQVSIYAGAQGTPTTYTDSDVSGFGFCSYDQHGNLFIGAGSTRHGVLVELPRGSGSFATMQFRPQPKHLHISGVQWDGKYLAVGGVSQHHNAPVIIYRVQITGSLATIEGRVKLLSRNEAPVFAQFSIQNGTVAQSSDRGVDVGVWNYPGGGNPVNLIRSSGKRALWGTVVSLAQ